MLPWVIGFNVTGRIGALIGANPGSVFFREYPQVWLATPFLTSIALGIATAFRCEGLLITSLSQILFEAALAGTGTLALSHADG